MTSVQPKTNHQATPSIHFCETFTGDLSNQVESPFAAVDDMSDYPLLCFSGPPGCGKRSFISKYARSRRLGCAHFQVVVEIFKKVPVLYPIKRNTAGSPPEEKSGAPEDEWPLDALLDDKLIADFVQSIVQNDPRIRFVVIENAHLLREAIFDFDWVCRQLSQLRCPLQFILMSSEKLPDALVSLCCRNRVALFSWFAPQTMPGGREIRGALRADLPLVEKPFPVMVSSDYEAMKAIVITLEADNADIINENSAFRDSMGYRISAGIFKRFSPTIRHFFLKTAFFSKMTNLMAEKLTGFANPESLLIQSCASSGHASDVSLPVKTYRYHPLLQKFLRQYAQEEYGETRISKEIAEVVKILIRNRMIEDVFSLLPDFVDFQLKCDCIINHASELMARNKVDLIEKALNSVPIKECLRNQRLGTWYGLVKLHKNPAGIGPFFNKLYCYFKKNNNIRWMCLSWIGAVDAVLLNLNQLGRLDGWIDEPITRLVLDGTFVPERWVSNRFLSGLLMALSLRKPTHPDLAQVYKKLIQADPYSDKNPAAVEILIRVIVYHMFAGDFSDLEIAMTDLVKKIKACAIPPVIRARAEYVRSLYLHYRGRFAKSRNGLKMAAAHAELSEESGIKEAISSLLVRGLIAGNEISSAQKYFNSQNSSYFASNSWENYHYFTMAMQIAAARKRLAKADTLGDNATIAADELGMPIYLITHKVDRVYLSVALEDYKKAHEQLIEAKRMAKGLTVSLLHLTIAFAEAYLNLSQSNRAVALDLLSSALRECRIRGLYGICMGPPKALENLCLASLEAGIEVEYVKSLIRRRKVKPDSPPVQIDDWPWPIKVYTLGRFAILNDNEKVIFPKKAKKKPLALLKALISFGGRGVREESILDALWPDVEADFAHRTFATTLHRLRKIIGNHNAVILKGGCLTLNPSYLWVDAWAFERVVGVATKLLHPKLEYGQHGYAVGKAQSAIDYYRGPFLGSEVWEPWAVNYGERLRNKYLRIVGKLGHFWEKSNHLEEAVECFQKSLEVDNTDEVAYRRLMACYIRMGRRSKALSTYRRCKEILLGNLGVVPSAEIENLKKSLNPAI